MPGFSTCPWQYHLCIVVQMHSLHLSRHHADHALFFGISAMKVEHSDMYPCAIVVSFKCSQGTVVLAWIQGRGSVQFLLCDTCKGTIFLAMILLGV